MEFIMRLTHLHPALITIIAITYAIALVWLANDVHDRWGQDGCVVVGAFYIALAPLFPLILITYIFLRQLAYRRPESGGRPEGIDQWTWRSQRQQQGQTLADLPNISPEESDEHIDLLLAEGKREEALKYAQDMLDAARGFGDEKGVYRYTKYTGYIRRGIR